MAPKSSETLRHRQKYDNENSSTLKNDDDGLLGFDQTQAASPSNDDNDVAVLFMDPETAEHRRSTLKNNPMSGMTSPHLCRLLFYEKFSSIHWWRYKARILCLLGVSLFNSVLSMVEWLYIKAFLGTVFSHVEQDDQPPLFILGHPRSGTTLLHSLIAQDTERFCTCSTFTAGFPESFLSFESMGKKCFASMLSPTRPMDNMKLHFDLPQEDELATCLLTGGRYSPYMSLYFMQDEEEYRQYQTMRNVADPQDVQCWTRAFQWLCLKLKVRNVLQQWKQHQRSLSRRCGQTTTLTSLPLPKRLLLKSPCHTGRIRHLLKLYPNAQFVYVHRHPLEVFLSSLHMANTTYGYMFLQQPRPGDLKEYILKQGEILIEEYVSCLDEVEELQVGKNLHQVSFQELTSNPYDVIKDIYNGLEGMDRVFSPSSNEQGTYPAKLKEYCESLKDYRKNQFDASKVNDELLAEIQTRWSIQFERFGYSKEL